MIESLLNFINKYEMELLVYSSVLMFLSMPFVFMYIDSRRYGSNFKDDIMKFFSGPRPVDIAKLESL